MPDDKLQMQRMVSAILKDDAAKAAQLLRDSPALATDHLPKPHLYNFAIFHWIYIGDTVLHLAAAGYRVAIAKLLLKAKADPNAAANHRRSTPLHYAADGFITGPVWRENDQVQMIRCLLERGADLHRQDKNGATPLHRAVRTRSAAAVRLLLDAGSDPASKNRSGSTPFHLAVQNTGRGGSGAPAAVQAQREIIREFFSRGVAPTLRDSQGKSVADSVQSAWIREEFAWM